MRSFKMTNQSHSCLVRDASHHFSNKKPEIKEIFDAITSIIDVLGPVQTSYVENAILIAATSTFLAVKPKKNRVDIEFLLDHEVTDFPVHKTVRASKNKIAHFVRFENAEEVDHVIANWLTEAYQLNVK